jgi:hypothetical protein
MKRFDIARDRNSIPTWARAITDSGKQILTQADTEYTVTIPAGANIAIFSATDHFFVSGASFTLPTSGVWSSYNVEMSPEGIKFEGETTLYIRSRSIVDLTISFYA